MKTFHRLAPRAVAACTLASIAGLAAASGEVITVTAGDDAVDFGGAQRVADLPGPDGKVSIMEAVWAANNTPGAQTIRFAIPKSEWWTLLTDRALIPVQYALWVNDADTYLDFASQTAFTGDTNPTGNEVGLYYVGPPANIAVLNINADRCTVCGMDMGRGNAFGGSISIQKNNCRVIGCSTDNIVIQAWGQSASGNVIGGVLPGEANTFYEIAMYSGASGNTVVGNTLSHVYIAGDTFYGLCNNNRIGGPSAQERNVISGYGRYGEEGLPTGTQVEVYGAVGTIVEGNYIGTNASGTASAGQRGPGGVGVGTGAVDTLIKGNLISGFRVAGINHYQGEVFGLAVGITSSATNTLLVGNHIGTDAGGSGTIPNVHGVQVQYFPGGGAPSLTTIGGEGPSDANVITGSQYSGILVDALAHGVRIQRNSIFGNGTVSPLGLGIDLLPPSSSIGVSPNDPGDDDDGGNGLQNFPQLASAERTIVGARLAGSLRSRPSSDYRIEFFASDTCHAAGHGEGRMFLGVADVHTDAAGVASIDASLGAFVPEGWFATATATEQATGSTSEFSMCLAFSGNPCPADFDSSGFVDTDDFDAFVASFTAGDPEADFDGSGFVDTDDFDAFVRAFEAGC